MATCTTHSGFGLGSGFSISIMLDFWHLMFFIPIKSISVYNYIHFVFILDKLFQLLPGPGRENESN